jgi:hypothetical protein
MLTLQPALLRRVFGASPGTEATSLPSDPQRLNLRTFGQLLGILRRVSHASTGSQTTGEQSPDWAVGRWIPKSDLGTN